ncbi:hypothetical protein MMMB2_4778 [Mycobacterium marinum MB2]|nr:hypothetical protein MMMB2_4778 [Mycobacterium marinum MB2]
MSRCAATSKDPRPAMAPCLPMFSGFVRVTMFGSRGCELDGYRRSNSTKRWRACRSSCSRASRFSPTPSHRSHTRTLSVSAIWRLPPAAPAAASRYRRAVSFR